MTEPTKTRAQLRRELARQLAMPFARRVGDSSTTTSGGSTSTAKDTAKLVQSVSFWEGSYYYNVTRDASRLITAFTTPTLTLEAAISAQVDGDTYEIHTIWSAEDLHSALNHAQESAFPAFFDSVIDETLILEEDKLSYLLTGLTLLPHRLLKVFVEQNNTVTRGTADSATGTTLTDADLIGKLASVGTGWRLSIYAGTGTGQIRTPSSVNNSTGQITVAAWTTTPDSTSKYTLWNTAVQRDPWERIIPGRPDQQEYPDYFHFFARMPESYGLRIRLQYTSKPSALTAEANTTMVPQTYLMHKARAHLYTQMVDDNRVDRSRYANLAELHEQLAMVYRRENAFRLPGSTLWQEEGHSSGLRQDPSGNPLGWR